MCKPLHYRSFLELSKHEQPGRDFKIRLRQGHTGILVMAPHGGNIEPGCSEIADAVASTEHSFYCFEGMKPRGNWSLHIPSTNFDEPICMQMLSNSSTALAIHGCKHHGDRIYLGGLDELLLKKIHRFLEDAGFRTGTKAGIQGRSQLNICNLGGSGRGAQLEVPFALRCKMFAHLKSDGRQHTTEAFHEFIQAVRKALDMSLFKTPLWQASSHHSRSQPTT